MNPFVFRSQNPLLGGQNMMGLLGGMGAMMPTREATMNIDDGNRGHTVDTGGQKPNGNDGNGGGNKDPDPKKKKAHPYALRYKAPQWSFPQYSQTWAFTPPKVR